MLQGAPGLGSLFFFKVIDPKAAEGVEGQDEGVSRVEDGFIERETGCDCEVGGDDGGEGGVGEAGVDAADVERR